eukprot:364523-Chlamydomonas_euryale.AAC.6
MCLQDARHIKHPAVKRVLRSAGQDRHAPSSPPPTSIPFKPAKRNPRRTATTCMTASRTLGVSSTVSSNGSSIRSTRSSMLVAVSCTNIDVTTPSIGSDVSIRTTSATNDMNTGVMMSTAQRAVVRMVCGWKGAEISRARGGTREGDDQNEQSKLGGCRHTCSIWSATGMELALGLALSSKYCSALLRPWCCALHSPVQVHKKVV